MLRFYWACSQRRSVEQIERWRSSGTFQESVGGFASLLGDFPPHTMELVAGIE